MSGKRQQTFTALYSLEKNENSLQEEQYVNLFVTTEFLLFN